MVTAMLKDKNYPGLDQFRLAAAFLIVAVHISPLSSFNQTADFILTRIIARVGVPFFLMTSGFFLLPPYLSQKSPSIRSLQRFWRKTGTLYGIAVLLYLPVNLYAGQLNGPKQLITDLLFNGTFYHLWYLPGAMLGAAVVALLCRRLTAKQVLAATGLLYVAGLLGDSYYGLSRQIPGLAHGYDLLFQCFDYTRNGLFFTPLFLALGGWIGSQRSLASKKRTNLCLLLSACCLLGEGLLLHRLGWQRHDSMYIALVPVMYFLFQRLLYANGEGRPQLRTLSTWIYLLHPLCLILVRGGAKATGLAWLLIDQSLVRYVAVCLLSLVLALAITALSKRIQPLANPQDRAWLEIDLDALIHNAQAIQEQLPPGCSIMAVVKADAYGHGGAAVAQTLARQGISAFAVATLQEAIALRKQGLKGEILILGYTPPVEAPLLSRYRLTQTLVDCQHAQALAAQGCRLQVQIKVDTGMRRLGESYLHSQQIRQMFQYDNLQVTGIYTHLCAADSDKPEDEAFTNGQIQNFTQLLQQLAAWGVALPKVHIQSSYGFFNYPGLACDYVRPGIALYGAKSARQDLMRAAIQLKPVLALKARISEVKDLAPGETVGYGRCFTAPQAMRIATLAIGYGDGIPRNLRGGQVLIKGRLAPIIGRICMDTLMVDISQLPEIRQGDQATLIGADGGQRILAEDLAQQAGTITNELFCGFGNRLPKLYRQDSKTVSQAERRRGKEES